MNLPKEWGITWLMPAVKTDTVMRGISEFERGKRGRLRTFGWIRQYARRVHPDGGAGRGRGRRQGAATGSSEGESFHHVFATNVSPEAVGSDPDRFVEMYRRRRGIETAFRCYEQVRPRTTSRNESVRLLLLFFPMPFHNAWILARHLFCRNGVSITWITLKIFFRYLEALTRESVRFTPTDPG